MEYLLAAEPPVLEKQQRLKMRAQAPEFIQIFIDFIGSAKCVSEMQNIRILKRFSTKAQF
jgi:hypothetical protein